MANPSLFYLVLAAWPFLPIPRRIPLPVRRLAHALEDPVDDLVGVDAFGVGVEVGEDAVAEDGSDDGADVGGADGQAAVEDGPRLGGQHDVLRGAVRPQASQLAMKSRAPGSLGWVARMRSTA